MHRKNSVARSLSMPETKAAFRAIEDVIRHFAVGKPQRLPQPLFLHGPAGVGKTHLVSLLVKEVAGQVKGHVLTVLSAGDLRWCGYQTDGAPEEAQANHATEAIEQARGAELLIVEDLQQLRLQAAETLVEILDVRGSRRLPTVVTAQVGPRHLRRGNDIFPARLTNRLAGGLVIALEPWAPASRSLFLEELAQRRQFAVPLGILPWLAEHLPGSGRVLDGALSQLESMARQQRRPLDLDSVARHFSSQTDAHQPTVERIADQVSGYFRLDASLLRSSCRYRNILVPRQVSMYLARKLTALSLEQIGAFFGGRDHTTVLHACRKMETVLAKDPVLSGAVRQLHAELV
jgi:chromosomal replication initiator protein